MFDPKATQLSGQVNPVDANGTFTFGLTATLANPLQFMNCDLRFAICNE